MKVAPVSADLLIKLALAAAALGVLIYGYKKASGAITDLVSLPGRAIDAVTATAKEGGAAWQAQTTPNPPDQQGFYGTYQGPLITDQGFDFGQVSG